MSHEDINNPGQGHRQLQGQDQIREGGVNGTWIAASPAQVAQYGPGIYPQVATAQSILEMIFQGEEGDTKGPPPGWFNTQKEAVQAARAAGAYTARGFQGDPVPGVVYPYDIIRNGLYFTHVGKEVEATADKRFSLVVDPRNGHTYAIDQANPTKPRTDADIIFRAANKAPEGSVPIGDPIELGNGKTMQPYAITDVNGVTTRTNVIIEADDAQGAPTAADIVTFTDLEGGGRLIPLGDGRYTYEAPANEPFKTSAQDVIPLPDQGGSLIKTSENQYQFVRDTYEPGIVQDPLTGRYFNQRPDGIWTELDPRYEPGVVQFGDREFFRQETGAMAELDPRYDPQVTDVDGMKLLQQRTGAVGQLTPPNLDQIITQALVDGEYDKAFAFQDFRDRPGAAETFQTALAFARSPADQRIISSIARGITPVQPPPEGTIQRVGPQPDFLVQAYQDFQRRTQAGRAPTEAEATDLSARAAAGETPLTDTLQTRLEELKIKNQELRNDAISMKTQQDEQVFEQNNQALFGGEDESLTKLKLDLGLSSGTNMPEGTLESLKRIIAGLPDSQKEYAASQVDSIHNRGLTVEQVIANLSPRTDAGRLSDYDLGITTTPTTTPTTVKGPGTPEENWASSLAAFPDLTKETFNLFGGVDLSKKTANEINAHAGAVSGQQFGATTVRSNILGGETFSKDFGWEKPADIERRKEVEIQDRIAADRLEQAALLESENQDTRSNVQQTSATGSNLSAVANASNVSLSQQGTTPGGVGAFNVNYNPNAPGASAITGKDMLAVQGAYEKGSMQPDTEYERQLLESQAASTDPFARRGRAGGGTVRPGEITVVGEKGPEIAMMPPGTHILPLGKATKHDIRAAQATGRAYQAGGIVFGDLPPGLQQLWRGRPITPPRGYLLQQGGLPLPSPQALQNLTPGTRESFMGMAGDIGISPAEFRQELQTATPRGTRLPTSRMLPLGRRGVR
jgi:hypothetical protein